MRGAHLKSFTQSGKSIHKFPQPLSVIHKAKAMQLLTANDDLAQLTGGRPLDDISKMPSDDRRAVLCKYLVKEDPVVVQEPIAWSDEESIGRFLLLKRFLNNDESRRHLLLEARRVFYEENSFIISLARILSLLR
ncbi:hypothetical protein NW765_016383 [Fusarium oxysporum]|nr:hypothetical protein NW765_016383 [Fusarium oxysporum]